MRKDDQALGLIRSLLTAKFYEDNRRKKALSVIVRIAGLKNKTIFIALKEDKNEKDTDDLDSFSDSTG